jgi:hypothetical protein
MNYIVILLLFAFATIGIYLGFYAVHNTRVIFSGSEISWKKRLINAIYMGLSISMIFMSIILVAGLIEPKYNWSLKNIFAFAAISGCLGIIVALGGIWQFFIVNKYRKKLINGINRRNKERKNN